MIGKITRVPLRDVWKNEACDFSVWLEDNIDALNDALAIALTVTDREKQVGSFSLDLLAQDEHGSAVIIENQLERSDHDHLGKVITYLSGLDAKAAIWITPDPRPEHVKAITWLNESAKEDFYLVKVEAIRIGDSMPAPLFTLIVGPSEDARAIGQAKKDAVETGAVLHRFWSGLLEREATELGRRANVKPQKGTWQDTDGGQGIGGFWYSLRKDEASVELYLYRYKEEGGPDAVYARILSHKGAIERAFGEPLRWVPPNGNNYARIRCCCPGQGYRAGEAEWPQMHGGLVKGMARLQQALDPYLTLLEVEPTDDDDSEETPPCGET
jgi:uncharacterized protein DUF4268